MGLTVGMPDVVRPEVLIYFVIIFGLLYAAVKVTEEYSSSWGNAIWKQGMDFTKKAVGVAVTAVLAVATGGAALEARSAAAVLNNTGLRAIATGGGPGAAKATAQLAAAQRKFENPMGDLKNAFAVIKKTSGLLGVKTSNPLADYAKDQKWDASKTIVQPSIARAYMGMDAYKSAEQVAKDNEKAQKTIVKVITKQQETSGKEDVEKGTEKSQKAYTTAKNNKKLILDRAEAAAETELNKKVKELEDNAEIRKIKTEMKEEDTKIKEINEKLSKLGKTMDDFEKTGKPRVSSPDFRKAVQLQDELRQFSDSNKNNQIKIKTTVKSLGLDDKFVNIEQNGALKANKVKEYHTLMADKLLENESVNLFGKTWKQVQAEEIEKEKELKAEKENQYIVAREKGVLNPVYADAMRKALKGETKGKKAIDLLKESFKEEEEEEKKTEEKPKEDKGEEKKEEKPKEEAPKK
jgi:hypothetical protein